MRSSTLGALAAFYACLNARDPAPFTAAFDRKLDRERLGLGKLRERHRESCAQWCWVEW